MNMMNLKHGMALFAVLALVTAARSALPPIHEEIHTLGVTVIDYVYKERFSDALDESKKIIRKFPDHPAGYFFYAASLDAWMTYYQSNKKENEFFQYCDLAIEKGEALVRRNEQDVWAQFFLGGAEGLKGTLETRYERWITAFRYGWRGVSVLKEIQKRHVDLYDTYYGIGTYDYWRSAMTRVMRWLPGVEDKRESGIQDLLKSGENGLFTRVNSSANLIDIYVNENRGREALELATRMLEKYPNSLVFLWGKAKAAFLLGQFSEAENEFQAILHKVEAESNDNHYNAVLCHYWLARVYLGKRQFTQCIAECNTMSHYQLDADIAARLQKQFTEAVQIKKNAENPPPGGGEGKNRK